MPTVLATKPGHDGAIALVVDGELLFSLEAEKDSSLRYGAITAALVDEALARTPTFPDVLALGGWHGERGAPGAVGAGYLGLDPGVLVPRRCLGRDVLGFSSSHERSHIVGAVAMSPFDRDEDLAVLVWEGVIGAFYRWRGASTAIERIAVLTEPGDRFAALFALADPSFPDVWASPRPDYAGKLMALAGMADGLAPTSDSTAVVEALLRQPTVHPFKKSLFRASPLHDAGVEHPELHRAARALSQRLFDRFDHVARAELPAGVPLVISGGCGLNCEWNRAWRDGGHFGAVFVPPCPNDSGSAIGTAVDAALALGAPCELTWSVYCGSEFVLDEDPTRRGWRSQGVDPVELARCLQAGAVVAWVEGRYEMGPRALGHRSLLASAEDPRSHARLNQIKQRESYRPIAPVCLESDLAWWFDDPRPDPHMLFLRRVRHPHRLPAITHLDATARVQSVSGPSAGRIYDLLVACRARSGVGVLCNTSLNQPGRGFINRMSDLLDFCEAAAITDTVVDDRWFTRLDGSGRCRKESEPCAS